MKHMSIVLIGVLSVSVQVCAELLAGTQDNAPYAGRVAVGEYGFGAGSPILQARPFTTGATAYNLTSIFFGANLYHAAGAGGISVSVYNNNGTVPGSIVAGGFSLFNASSNTVGLILNAGSTLTLAANSTYWFVASVDQSAGATRYWWNLTDSAAIDSEVPGFGMPLSSANNAVGWQAYDGSSLQMSVYGAVVPEPATFSFFSITGMGAYLVRSKRQKRYRKNKSDAFEELVYIPSFMEEEHAGRH